MSKLHKICKSIFYEDITKNISKSEIQGLLEKYELLEKSSKTQADKEVAKILIRRFKDLLLILQ